jgi:iron(III) transport system ATP-binding protein
MKCPLLIKTNSGGSDMSHNVVINDVVKQFGDFTAVNKVNICIGKGEFFTLLGPSGCGKTTLLRMIAGFHKIDDGTIRFDEKLINNVEAHKRDIGMVFQNYAIFPHMTVYENVAYGLKAKKFPRNEIDKRTKEALELVQISALSNRKPSELSGGQQQRVALARAFVIEPGVLLMDEPLSNLDAKLRVQMRTIIKKLQRRLGITTVYVTHDQEEALAISDNIAVMKDGNIMQIGTPEDIYKKPQNVFVAGFIGTSNFLEGEVVSQSEDLKASIRLKSGVVFEIVLKRKYNGNVNISIRPEEFKIMDDPRIAMPGKIIISTFLGDFVNYEVQLNDGSTVEVNEYTKDIIKVREVGQEILLSFVPEKISIFDSNGTEAIV